MEKDPAIYFWAHMLDEAMEDKCLLLEDREGKNINRAEKWIKDNAPQFIGQKINGHAMRSARDVVTKVRQDVPSSRLPYELDAQGNKKRIRLGNGDEQWKGTCKYLPGVCRLYLAELPEKTNSSAELISLTARLNELVNIVATRFDLDFKDDDGGRDFNGMTFDQLEAKYGQAADEAKKNTRDAAKAAAGKLVRNKDYSIIPIDSFSEANEYSRYVSWCVTQDQEHYDSYKNGGLNRFYFVLRKDFRTVSRNDPDYAKTMLAVMVDPNGDMTASDGCTSRLNNGGSYMTVQELQELLGVDFYETFKPLSVDKIWQKLLNEQDTPDDFCGIFGCVRLRKWDPGSDQEYDEYYIKDNGKVKRLFNVDGKITYIDGRFVTKKGNQLIPSIPERIQPYAFAKSNGFKKNRLAGRRQGYRKRRVFRKRNRIYFCTGKRRGNKVKRVQRF